jgi:hypothetical protein
VAKPTKELTPKEWVVESKKRANRRISIKTNLAAAHAAQERADALAYAATFQAHMNVKALAAQAVLLVDDKVLANMLAMSCGLTASKPLIVRIQVPTVSRLGWRVFRATALKHLHQCPDKRLVRDRAKEDHKAAVTGTMSLSSAAYSTKLRRA